ncbi:MAG: MMPL family transporter [Saprospiraceae bacterium]|nr:MMPL family transporter [Bacteroidia bacterium]NNE16685.1 MMPL family transporter [Saprospiraceae bacterium]NNL93706.1 MMPL family transporter [Saprospiraceae bacterium]
MSLIIGTVVISLLCLLTLPHLKFAFNFEQFFPTGDKDLEFFQEFIEEFETDDNFLLIAFVNEPSIFDTSFLKRLKTFSIACQDVSYVTSVQSLPLFGFPTMSPIGPIIKNAVHLDNPSLLKKDSIRLLNDERILYTLVNEKATATAAIIKTEDEIQIKESKIIMHEVDSLLSAYNMENYHILGRAYFQTELSELQFKEITISTIISGILISIVMIFIFSKWRSILIALSSIGLALLIFLGVLSLLGRELSLMAALYPILMLIVGTSDVIHIMTKYFDELKSGKLKKEALEVTIKQIGMATLLTSLTTAVGFATLLSSRIIPIKEFGINSAIGVIIAYIVVITFTCPLLTYFSNDQLLNYKKSKFNWTRILTWSYNYTLNNGKRIVYMSFLFLGLSIYGISLIHTNYELQKNLPQGAKITEDFMFFEKEFAGFRPLELAITIKEGYNVFDYEVIDAVARTEAYVKSQAEIFNAFSLATMIKSINQMLKGDDPSAYKMPTQKEYERVSPFLDKIPLMGSEVLISKDRRKTRISSRIKDVGAENIQKVSLEVDDWISNNIDSSVVTIKQTGTGIILDKNAEFVRESLLYGLGIALLIVSLLMGLLFRRIRFLLIALIPNIVPLLFAAALLGYANIALEAGVSIVFAIIFGIAVDDTIHFMSKYKLAKDRNNGDKEKALLITFLETGKAIIYTSIILFFGFLVLMFSSNLPSVIIGLLISVTLVSAVVADLFLLPVIIRKFDD